MKIAKRRTMEGIIVKNQERIKKITSIWEY